MSMWVMAASPLLTCNDVRNMTDDIKQILTNEEVLAVHKDALVKMAVRIDVGGGVVRSRPASRPCFYSYLMLDLILFTTCTSIVVSEP